MTEAKRAASSMSGGSICWSAKVSPSPAPTSSTRRSAPAQRNGEAITRTAAHNTLVLGTEHYSRSALEELRAAGRSVHIRVLGLAGIADDVTPELALTTIASVDVLGAFRASPAVKAALAARTV